MFLSFQVDVLSIFQTHLHLFTIRHEIRAIGNRPRNGRVVASHSCFFFSCTAEIKYFGNRFTEHMSEHTIEAC